MVCDVVVSTLTDHLPAKGVGGPCGRTVRLAGKMAASCRCASLVFLLFADTFFALTVCKTRLVFHVFCGVDFPLSSTTAVLIPL